MAKFGEWMAVRRDIVDSSGNKLQSILDARGLTMAALARKANVSVEVVRRLRDGKTLRRDKFFAIVNQLGVSPVDVIPSWSDVNEMG